MARKNDPQVKENLDRGTENKQESANIDSGNTYEDDVVRSESDTIKNANATGLGAIGRNDEKQTDYTSKPSSEGENK